MDDIPIRVSRFSRDTRPRDPEPVQEEAADLTLTEDAPPVRHSR